VTLRKVPGALALGLLASLIAHGSLYGGSHSMGGDYHDLLLDLALAAGAALLIFFGGLAWNGALAATSGSVLAARLSARLPGFGSLATAAAAWYAAAEFVEPHHAATSWLAAMLCLAIASWLVLWLSRCALAILAGAILAFFGAAFAPRTTARFVRPTPIRFARSIAWVRRLFARPPPIAVDCCA
jgi:hypothetical protein